MKQSFKVFIFTLLLLGMISCAETDQDKIGDAQFCLDDLPVSGLSAAQRKSQVNSCVAKLGSVTGKQASLIRCSAGFIIEGFGDPALLVDIMKKMDSNQSGGVNEADLMGVLAFKTEGSSETATSFEDTLFAKETLNHCNDAGNPGYVWIAFLVNTATNLASLANQYGANNIQDLLNNPSLVTDPAVLAQSDTVLGATAVIAYQSSCNSGDQANEQICNQLGGAIAASGGDPQVIGAALRDYWK